MRAELPGAGVAAAGVKLPAVAPRTRTAKGAPLKSLGALDQLFRK
jgi:hypothetical protein